MRIRSKKIRRILLALLIILVTSTICYGASLEISWTANTESDLASYRIYQTTTENVWGASLVTVNAPLVTYTIPTVTDGSYWYALTALDTAGNESPKSTAVKIVINLTAPVAPTGLKLLLKN